jgi:hypothetical protein
MLSITAYDQLNVIVEGEITVHILKLGLLGRNFSNLTANEVLLSTLVELSEAKAILCFSHSEYGYSRPQLIGNTIELLNEWSRQFGTNGPEGSIETSGTISITVTEFGKKLVLEKTYEVYLPFLRKWCGWPNDELDL